MTERIYELKVPDMESVASQQEQEEAPIDRRTPSEDAQRHGVAPSVATIRELTDVKVNLQGDRVHQREKR